MNMSRYIVRFLLLIYLLPAGIQQGFAADINNFGKTSNSRSATTGLYDMEDVNEPYDNDFSLNFERIGDNNFSRAGPNSTYQSTDNNDQSAPFSRYLLERNRRTPQGGAITEGSTPSAEDDFLTIDEQVVLESQAHEWAKFRRGVQDKKSKLEIAVNSSFGGFSNTPKRADYEANEYKPNTRNSHSDQESSFNSSDNAIPFYFRVIHFIKNAHKEYSLALYSLIFLAVIFMFVKAVLRISPARRRPRRRRRRRHLPKTSPLQTKAATTPLD